MLTGSTRWTAVALLPFAAAALSGCFYSREIAKTRDIIEEEIPGSEFDRRFVFSVGTRTLRAAEWIATLAPEEEADGMATYLDDVERMKVGIFDTKKLPEDDSFGVPALAGLEERGWEVAVRTRDERDRVWVLYRSHRSRIRGLFVIVLDRQRLVIARLDGHLDRLLKRAVADHRPFTRLAHR